MELSEKHKHNWLIKFPSICEIRPTLIFFLWMILTFWVSFKLEKFFGWEKITKKLNKQQANSRKDVYEFQGWIRRNFLDYLLKNVCELSDKLNCWKFCFRPFDIPALKLKKSNDLFGPPANLSFRKLSIIFVLCFFPFLQKTNEKKKLNIFFIFYNFLQN